MGRRPEKSEISPVRQGAPTVSVPYLIRPKLDSNTVSTNSGSWDADMKAIYLNAVQARTF